MGDHDWYRIRPAPPTKYEGPKLSKWREFQLTYWAPIAEFGGWLAIFLVGLFVLNVVLSVSR